MICSGVLAAARSTISRTAGSCLPISSRSESLSACTWSSSASSISVESNRLPRLSGAMLGWSGSTIAAPSIAVSVGFASTGNVLTLSHSASASACGPLVSIGETKRPPVTSATTCVEIRL